jgi:hypothetical protein
VWPLLALPAQSVALPPETPIPCLICRVAPAAQLVFSGTVQLAESGRLRVFNGKTRETMGFLVPAGFHGVESSDGKIKDATVTRVSAGLLARVTYRTLADDRLEVTRVLLLTINQCRALVAAERLSDTSADCPD